MKTNQRKLPRRKNLKEGSRKKDQVEEGPLRGVGMGVPPYA
jgi:hypothetical protein